MNQYEDYNIIMNLLYLILNYFSKNQVNLKLNFTKNSFF